VVGFIQEHLRQDVVFQIFTFRTPPQSTDLGYKKISHNIAEATSPYPGHITYHTYYRYQDIMSKVIFGLVVARPYVVSNGRPYGFAEELNEDDR
jgi:hypothetical protein